MIAGEAGTRNPLTRLSSVEIYEPPSCEGCSTIVTLSVSAPTSVAAANGAYQPNPVQVVGTLKNVGSTAASNVKATLYPPPGITVANGAPSMTIATLAPGESRQVTWNAQIAAQTTQRMLSFIIGVSADNAPSVSVRRDLTVPGIFRIDSFTPTQGGNAGTVTIDIRGSGFLPGATVKLGSLTGQETTVVSPERIQTRFDLTGHPAVAVSLQVTNPGGASASAAQSFTVVTGGESDLTAEVIAPSVVRAGRPYSFSVVVRNNGLVDARDVRLDIGAFAEGSAPSGATVSTTSQSFDPNQLQLPVGGTTSANLPIVPSQGTVTMNGRVGPATNFCIEVRSPCSDLVKLVATGWLVLSFKHLKTINDLQQVA